MFELKRLSNESVPRAIEKAEHYRLLKEPVESESICRDILEIDPDNQRAITTLVLALTDQFGQRQNPDAFREASEIVNRLSDEYRKLYYTGIILERRAKAYINQGAPGAGQVAYEWFARAMSCFQKAMELSPAENEDAILRWNSCVRIQMRNPDIAKATGVESVIMDDDPSGPWGAR
ncbi:MAG: hypothetical protein PHP23_12240 [Desulfobacterales bacterium]|nr:hypothetical protein [Desulfobacterales bacterium]MDD4071935.1 hypothetical protein [Desulfobacterales bacterium]MDD4393765.1 hypothetical protein [Desulfobacterales bacterium]